MEEGEEEAWFAQWRRACALAHRYTSSELSIYIKEIASTYEKRRKKKKNITVKV